MLRQLLRPALLGIALLTTACGGAARGGQINYDRDRISAAEIEDALARNITNAYDMIQSSRSQWLRPTGTGMGGSAMQVAVYENTNRLGGIEQLRNIPLSSVESIRWLSPSEAGAQFGLNVNHGAIQVLSRTGR